jgi:GNAT superfamily N-acetyltransferase
VRLAGPADAPLAAKLLDDFNTEFETPSPGISTLAQRLEVLLGSDSSFAVLAEARGKRSALGIALVTLRRNVWHEGPVALLDELYVVPAMRAHGMGTAILERAFSVAADHGAELFEVNVDEGDTDARRFYERHGFTGVEPDSGEPALYYSKSIHC